MKTFRAGLIALAATAAMVGNAQALYAGSAKDAGVTFRSWGSGLVRETDEMAPEVPHVIRISSRNFDQGGLIRFSKPTSLAASYQDKDNLLRFIVNFAGPTPKATAPATPTTNPMRGGDTDGDSGGDGFGGGANSGGLPPTGGGVPPTGGPQAGGRRGGPGLGGGIPGVGGLVPPAAAPATPTFPAFLRLVITTTDGKKSDAYVEVPAARARGGGWIPAAIPVQAIAGFSNTNTEILSILVSSDAPTTMYLRDISVVKDETPIYADLTPSTDLNLAFGDEYTFTASGYGGATQLNYEWNFDAANVKGVDAWGRTVKRRFRKAGEFVVQVTVRDIYGYKKPFVRSIKVKVNP